MDEKQVAPKPYIADMPPATGDPPPSIEPMPEEPMLAHEAKADNSVDDREQLEPRNMDLPEGATREDYAREGV